MQYLVTGGCGFIGAHLTDALIAAGHRVTVLDDLSSGVRAHCPPRARFLRGDVARPADVADAMRGVNGVFHLAAIASVARCTEDWSGTHAVNLSGTIAVLDAARRANVPVLYASSAAVYGDHQAPMLAESAPTRPRSAYGADKLGCELHAGVARECYGLPTLGLRFFNVYGPRQNGASPYSGVISIFRERLLRGETLRIAGDGAQTRDFIYVADVVQAAMAGMDRLHAGAVLPPVLNVCTGQAVSITALAETLARVSGQDARLEYGPARPGDIRHSCGDPSLLHSALGLRPATSLADGLGLMRELMAA